MHWIADYQKKLCTAEEAVSHIKSGDRIIQGQMHGVSQLLINALCARKEELMDVTVLSSINFSHEPYLEEGYAPHINYRNYFLYPPARAAFQAGRIEYGSMFFVDFPYWLEREFHPTVAMPVLTPPDEDGYCSFSMNGDYIVASCRAAEKVIAHINPLAPRTGGAKIHVGELTYAVEAEQPLNEIPVGRTGEAEAKIAAYITERIPDGACLQLGIGGIPDTVLSLLHNSKNLGIHTEMISDGIVALFEKGVITNSHKQIDIGRFVTTCIVGSRRLHKFVDNNFDMLVMPVEYTNDPYIISQNDNVVSINACLEVDLLGQVNADSVNGQPFSGIGGQVDYVRGATRSKNGQSFITLPSTALKGTVSTIVPRLQSPVTTSRFDVHSIVTEYGIADLWGKSYRERARALIAIAHPDFREELERAAYETHILY